MGNHAETILAQGARMTEQGVMARARDLMEFIEVHVHDTRRKSIALMNVEQAAYWATHAIRKEIAEALREGREPNMPMPVPNDELNEDVVDD